MYLGVGAGTNARSVVTTCPHCSYLLNGSCVICEDGDPHPGCESCEGGRLHVPWYRHDLFLSMVAGTIVAVTSTWIVLKLTGLGPLGIVRRSNRAS